MSFAYTARSIRTAALQLDYFLVPWDSEILGVPVAQISELHVTDPTAAARDYEEFARWCEREGIALCSCRVPAERVADSMFLEERGFRTIELNYLPRLEQLQSRSLPQDALRVAPATPQDRELLADMAAQVFRHGRFHQDPRIDPALGDQALPCVDVECVRSSDAAGAEVPGRRRCRRLLRRGVAAARALLLVADEPRAGTAGPRPRQARLAGDASAPSGRGRAARSAPASPRTTCRSSICTWRSGFAFLRRR